MTWFCVVNPNAGRGGSPYDGVVDTVQSLGIDATIHETESPAHLSDIVGTAVRDGFEDFISVGGDGTAHLVLNALMGSGSDTRFRLAIVAAGSGSDFVRTFGHRRGILEGLSRVASDPLDLYTVDIGIVRGAFGERFFLNALNVGVAAASAHRAESFPRWTGSVRYTAAFWLALWRFRTAGITVRTDNRRFDGTAINVVIANGQFFGGGLNIAPRSILEDGYMDVQVFLGPRRQAFSVMPRVIRGTHLTHRGVRRFTASTATMDVPDDWPVEADGEILGSGSVTIDVLPSRLDIVI